jgi:hypothetical protein
MRVLFSLKAALILCWRVSSVDGIDYAHEEV